MDSESKVEGASIGRRRFLVGAGALIGSGLGAKALWDRYGAGQRADVFVAKAESYEVDLERVIREGLSAIGWDRPFVRGRTVLLKPNLVEPSREAPHVNTHPALVRAVADLLEPDQHRLRLPAESTAWLLMSMIMGRGAFAQVSEEQMVTVLLDGVLFPEVEEESSHADKTPPPASAAL